MRATCHVHLALILTYPNNIGANCDASHDVTNTKNIPCYSIGATAKFQPLWDTVSAIISMPLSMTGKLSSGHMKSFIIIEVNTWCSVTEINLNGLVRIITN
jgi:hypothetical protein